MLKKHGVNLLAVMLCTIVLLTGWGCTKKISTTETVTSERDKEATVTSEPGKESYEIAGEVVEEPEYIQEAALFDERGGIAGDIPDSGSLVLKLEDIFFDFDRAAIRPDGRRALGENAQILKGNPKLHILIEGHADEHGTNEYNIALGERRAMAVKKYLVALGIDPDTIKIISYGEEKPFCIESGESCWKLNRRAHFVSSD
ncbi:MAG TPA: peptidoglycan-associated lipoprotein Pal [Nitrospiraceae bacterium]|nr:MAG: peptidoglycan-associated lipoprotein [Nitrospirae bacterium RIFCSPHIGHO2_02_FULL_42_12]HBI24992.1 peptidoglycan-associated lipoprotein Pal [Nitrospiraceae bacterium]